MEPRDAVGRAPGVDRTTAPLRDHPRVVADDGLAPRDGEPSGDGAHAPGPDAAPTGIGAPPEGSPAGTALPVHDLEPVEGADFTAFYREAWDPVCRGLAVTLGDHQLAAEATDEGMTRAYARWGRISTYDNPAGWVYRVGLNWARSHHRRLRRQPPAPAPPVVEPEPVADPAVLVALGSLPLAQRSVVVCRLLLDWSVEDTAAALSTTPGTVKSRMHRALRALETTLADLR